MAQSKITRESVKPPIKEVQLTLNIEETKTLIMVMRRVGGSPHDSRRKYCDNIHHALDEIYQEFADEIDKGADTLAPSGSGLKFHA